MRQLALAVPLLLALTGCGGGTTLPPNALILQVQAAMVQACGFLPAPLSMAVEIISHYNIQAGAAASVVATAVNAACGALPKPSAGNFGAPVSGGTILDDVDVDGVWVTPPKQ